MTKLDPFEAAADHGIDGVAAAAPDSDHLDFGSRRRDTFRIEAHRRLLP